MRDEKTYSTGENISNSSANYSSRQYSTNILLFLSDIIWHHSWLRKFYNNIFTHNRNNYRIILFFINRHITNGQTRRQELQTYYNNLKEDVLRHWLNQKAEPSRTRESLNESLIPLYIDIIKDLKTPIHSQEFKSHLSHNDNKNIHNIFEDLEKREPAHNYKLSEFMSSKERKIRNAIMNKDSTSKGGCNIDHIIEYDSGYEPRMPNYIMRQTVFYYRDKAQTDNLDLDIRPLDDDKKIFQLHYNMTEIGRGDEESMRCLSTKLKALEPDLVDDLKALINKKIH